MPLYDYDCAACGRRVEVIHGVHAPGPTHCPNCGSGPMKKAITAAAVHFKGTGWAKRDRRVSVAPGPKSSGDSATPSDGDGKDGSSKEPTSEPKSGTADDRATESGAPSGGESKTSERHAVTARKPAATTTTVSD